MIKKYSAAFIKILKKKKAVICIYFISIHIFLCSLTVQLKLLVNAQKCLFWAPVKYCQVFNATFFFVWPLASSSCRLHERTLSQVWPGVPPLSPQIQSSTRSVGGPPGSLWRRTRAPASLCGRTRSSGSSSATTGGVNSTSTRSASASEKDLTATFTGEPWKEPGQTSSHRFLSSREKLKCPPETDWSPQRLV